MAVKKLISSLTSKAIEPYGKVVVGTDSRIM